MFFFFLIEIVVQEGVCAFESECMIASIPKSSPTIPIDRVPKDEIRDDLETNMI